MKLAEQTYYASGDREADDRFWPFPKPPTGRIAVKVINNLGDEVMKIFSVE